MAHVTYKIVPHDGGWTYTLDGVFAETYRTRPAAIAGRGGDCRPSRGAVGSFPAPRRPARSEQSGKMPARQLENQG